MATYSSILAWRIPWTEEPGRLQPTGSQRVGHDSTHMVRGNGSGLDVHPEASCVWVLQQDV